MRHRVMDLRHELESKCEQLEVAQFELPCDDIPSSLDRKRQERLDLITVNPGINGLFEMIDDYAQKHGWHEFLDFNAKLFDLKVELAKTGSRSACLLA